MLKHTSLAVVAALTLAACGSGSGGGDSPAASTPTPATPVTPTPPVVAAGRGVLQQNPPQVVSKMSSAEISANRAWSDTLAVTGAPQCGVTVHYIQYGTVGANGEATSASGALMVPTGTSPACSGPRPIVVYAHGTAIAKKYNIAAILNGDNVANSESVTMAAGFAAQGYIVVAPNYAGYDSSPLPYHPYLNADQQAKDVIDALAAARSALPNVGAVDSGKLFLTGHSQGGYVVLAVHKALQAAGQTVTASAPSSGPYALSTFGDTVFYGRPSQYVNVFMPLIVSSYQQAYGNLYGSPGELYNPVYANGLVSALPGLSSFDALTSQGVLPPAMFSTTAPTAPAGSPDSLQAILNAATRPPLTPAVLAPTYAAGFGSAFLINNSARAAYLADAVANPDGSAPALGNGLPPAHPASALRAAFQRNDLRNWTARSPVLLCGGNADPMVYFDANTQNLARYWSAPSGAAVASGLLTVLDVDSPVTANDPYAVSKQVFSSFKGQVVAHAVAAGATDGGASALSENYHPTLVSAACMLAARSFFQQAQASAR